jgi:hypothetical protein
MLDGKRDLSAETIRKKRDLPADPTRRKEDLSANSDDEKEIEIFLWEMLEQK